ncbi:PASTA domain-containing protein [Nocardia sp. alder85J]|uniref:PASTA domain-containing protein n=1 Tax=Nocardia sp. alder85J TaxID=2862949 RepID=UPI001CD2782F|nr:PASTA domain-containing protein [Nocardia sp. alder85J]MCX4091805.1 PASTA domain-containing protein [Nocardia sp. alder85J]
MRRPAVIVPVSVVFVTVLAAVAGCGDSGAAHSVSATSRPPVAAGSPAQVPATVAAAPSSVAAAPDSSTTEPSSSSATPTTTAVKAAVRCAAQGWPQPIPDFRGQPLAATVVGAGLCYAITGVATADGHDVMHDPRSFTTPWTITGQTPDPGTAVAANTPVTLTVAAAPQG